MRIKYDLVSETGPVHAKVYEIKCSLTDATGADLETYTATGPNIVKAKQNVAELAWAQTKLEKPPPPPPSAAAPQRPYQNNYNTNNWNRPNNYNMRGGGPGWTLRLLFLLFSPND